MLLCTYRLFMVLRLQWYLNEISTTTYVIKAALLGYVETCNNDIAVLRKKVLDMG